MKTLILLSALSVPKVYQQKCMSCHGQTGTGQVGPNIQGSSLELLKLKVRDGKYPQGYKPKRPTRAMPKLKVSDAELKQIFDFLNKKCNNTCG